MKTGSMKQKMRRSMGLLSALLPPFERDYGYTVEICSGGPEDLASWAGSGAADVVLLTAGDVSALGQRGFVKGADYISTVYSPAE